MRPRIAIPVPTTADLAYNQRSQPVYARAIELSGGEAVEISLSMPPAELRELLATCSGVCLPGSPADVDPSLYGAERDPATAPADPAREAMDTALLEDAEKFGKPVFAICFGLQFLNVWRGGSLIQDLTPLPVNHEAGSKVAIAHAALIAQPSLLASLTDTSEAPEPATIRQSRLRETACASSPGALTTASSRRSNSTRTTNCSTWNIPSSCSAFSGTPSAPSTYPLPPAPYSLASSPKPPSMAETLTKARLTQLLAPYLADAAAPPELYAQLSLYLDLLLRWNARTNLTAIRDPETIVQRHFGESLFTARHLAPLLPPNAALLDFGSGAGFPGLPIQLFLTTLRVTLAESQGKKASFLREAVRTLNLPHTEVWPNRVESLPAPRRFDAITLRAVDNMPEALATARPRLASHGWLAVLTADPPTNPAATTYQLPQSHTLLILEPQIAPDP